MGLEPGSTRCRSRLPAGTDAPPADLVELGRVSGAYGVQGWLRIRAHASHSATLLNTKQWWLQSPATAIADAGDFYCLDIIRVRVQGAHLVARAQGLTDRTQALALRGHTVWVPRSKFAPAEPDEYYWADLIGCLLYGENDAGQSVLLGEVTDVSDNGAHALLHVTRQNQLPDGERVTQHDARGRARIDLVPFVEAHVHTVDLAEQRLLSNWPSNF